VLAQKPNAEQTKKAIERSENAASIITKTVSLKDNGIPGEVISKAKAVAVFPHVVKAKMLFQQLTMGFGVISRHLSGGWSAPAYYTFAGGGFDLVIAGGESADVIVLFMNEEAANLFQKGRLELKGKSKAVAGPVGSMANSNSDIANANIIMYSFNKGQLTGISVNSNLFIKTFSIVPDNKLNKAIYGIKSSEVLSGRSIDQQSIPPGISSFQQALTQSFTP
jgi:lipid-binding SYLF domain-containing protein